MSTRKKTEKREIEKNMAQDSRRRVKTTPTMLEHNRKDRKDRSEWRNLVAPFPPVDDVEMSELVSE